MAMTFEQAWADPGRRDRLIRDSVRIIEDEVAERRGITGMALKAGFAAFQRVQPGILRVAVEKLLPDFGRAIEPHWTAAGRAVPTFAGRATPIADDLLAVTDRLVARTRYAVIGQIYRTLRPSARDHVAAAVPRLGRLLGDHLG